MILEVAMLQVKPGEEINFETDFAIAGQYISAVKGYAGHSLSKCIQQANKYMLLVHWENLADHTVGFRESDHYKDWKRLLHHYYHPFPTVEHYECIIENKISD
ncbi:MAG: antibiotic biosynthesis monooxygenase [Daejeonella sp.]|nr:antibiotic biosynthesis monooxygenase [Daejeonella sp.]